MQTSESKHKPSAGDNDANIEKVAKSSTPNDEKQRSTAVESSTPNDGSINDAVTMLKYEKPKWYQRIPFTMTDPPPPRASMDDAPEIPDATASIFSLLSFHWLTPILSLGYARPLETTDLWALDPARSSSVFSEKISESFERRRKVAEEYNERLKNGEVKPSLRKRVWWTVRGGRKERETRWREKDGRKEPSLTWAMNDSVKWWFWSGGIFKVIGDTSQVTSPLVVKELIRFAQQSYASHRGYTSAPPPPIGKGVGLAFGLLFMQLLASICTHQWFYRSMMTGVYVRAGLIEAIYNRSISLTSRARTTLPNGKLVNHISTDVSRIDFCAGWFHVIWAAPIQLIICLVLLLVNLGYSSLAGFAVFVLITPVQTKVMKKLFQRRKKSMEWTDKRAKLLQELLSGIRILKFFAWEDPFLERVADYRNHELHHIRSILLIRSANNAVAFSLPSLAAVISFVIYAVSGHSLQPDIIFTSLTLFQLLRMPLMFLPMGFSAVADAQNAIQRLQTVFLAEMMTDTRVTDTSMDVAIRVENGEFIWDGAAPDDQSGPGKHGKGGGRGAGGKRGGGKKAKKGAHPGAGGNGTATPVDGERIFKLKDINLEIPKDKVTAIVGPVGSGKSSLLQALIGEMRKTEGSVKFSGSVSYCPQTAWIQSATIRENITFGRPFEEDRYWSAIHASCLEADINSGLPNGDFTPVGEKGISLSGGQKQRINVARSIYHDADIILADDPLSALDAHVGKAVFQNVFQGSLRRKTRVLVTHALHFLKEVDYIVTMVDGQIAERGTYAELMEKNGAFAKFLREFGNDEDTQKEGEDDAEGAEGKKGAVDEATIVKKEFQKGQSSMQAEERNTGAVSMKVYRDYFAAAHGAIILPLLFFSLVFMQGANVMGSYWLVYWQERKWPYPQGFYMGIYAGLAVCQTIGMFLLGAIVAFIAFYASIRIHRAAATRIIHAPTSFFDTTPLGRIMNRFSKDIDTMDNLLADALRMFAGTISQIVGAIILISVVIPWFLLPLGVLIVIYYMFALFYRSSARELKRLDAILRSSLYSHFSESLSGLATIRAYGEAKRFKEENRNLIDKENRAYVLTVANQRWLGVRLDFLGALLTFMVAILGVAARYSISPNQSGLILSYILLVQQSFSWAVRQSAEVENDMNAVERLLYYAQDVEQEAPYEIEDRKPKAEWPTEGAIEFKDVVMSYRPGLPAVLKGLTMSVRPRERIGIVGRTGAGKSSIMIAIYRMVEILSGSISIDGVDISQIGLKDLRSQIAIIPQDPLLFSGTLRSNLDPFGMYDDARLWDALKRAYLVDQQTPVKPGAESTEGGDDEKLPSGAQTPTSRFTLDTTIDDEGSNLSVGQRSLVSLARALVKNSQIIVLDEATASVDYETDKNIQDTIANEFNDRTLLCIAHRLRTILSYDRICVMDAGQIAEFDTPTNLFSNPQGIFRTMCDRSSITLEEIRLASKSRQLDES